LKTKIPKTRSSLKFFFNLTFLSSLSALFILGCSDDDKKTNKPNQVSDYYGNAIMGQSNDPKKSRLVTITDYSDQPIPNAEILLGEQFQNGEQENLLISDQNGQFVAPPFWTKPLTVTVQAPGFIRASFLNQVFKGQKFRLHMANPTMNFELRGRTSGHQITNSDGFVDVAMIIPAMTRKELFNFELNNIVSAQSDELSVYGQKIKVPSNLSIPNQKESYKFVPITLDKLNYRMNFPKSGKRKVFAAAARLPFGTLIDQLRAGVPFTNLINLIDIRSAGLSEVNLKNPSTEADIAVNQVYFQKRRRVQAPAFGNALEMITVGVSDLGGYLLPTDVKRMNQNESIQLGTAPQRPEMVLSVLKRKPGNLLTTEQDSFIPAAFINSTDDAKQGPHIQRGNEFNQMSAVLNEDAGDFSPEFLPLVAPPEVNSYHELTVPNVNTIPGVSPIATILMLSVSEEKANQDGSKSRVQQIAWEVYADDWVNHVTLPDWTLPLTGDKKKWEIALVGGKNNLRAFDETQVIDNASHITHSYTEF